MCMRLVCLSNVKVSPENQGRYTCTPYNVHGTAGSSGIMEVLVREPPIFVTKPTPIYHRKIDDDIQMNCEAKGTPNPSVTWRRINCTFLLFPSLRFSSLGLPWLVSALPFSMPSRRIFSPLTRQFRSFQFYFNDCQLKLTCRNQTECKWPNL